MERLPGPIYLSTLPLSTCGQLSLLEKVAQGELLLALG
jgi:hypothetical protein